MKFLKGISSSLFVLQRRERVEREVKRLREEISVKKTAVTTATKGIPANKIEVRPTEQQPQYSGPMGSFNPMLVGLSNEAQMILQASMNNNQNSGSWSPTKQFGMPSIGMDADLEAMENYQPPSSRQLQQPTPSQSLVPLPRSAKISMDEAAEAAVSLAAANTNQPPRMPGAPSRLPNGRPPAIQTGTT